MKQSAPAFFHCTLRHPGILSSEEESIMNCGKEIHELPKLKPEEMDGKGAYSISLRIEKLCKKDLRT